MGWFNETHEGDNPESNTEKNTDNVEANSEEVDKKMDDFASKTEEGGEKSSFWDKLKSKFSKQETGGEGSEEEQHESFVEYLRNPKNFQGSWDVGKKEKVEKTSGNGDAGENDEDPHGIPEREIGDEIPRYSKPEQSRDDDWER